MSGLSPDAVATMAALTVALERGDREARLAADNDLVRAVRGDARAYCACERAARVAARRRGGR